MTKFLAVVVPHPAAGSLLRAGYPHNPWIYSEYIQGGSNDYSQSLQK